VATVRTEFVEHLDAAIAALDADIGRLNGEIATLTDVRDQTAAIRALYGSPTQPAPEPDPTPEPEPLRPAAKRAPAPPGRAAAKAGRPRMGRATAGGIDYTAIATDITELRAAGRPVQSGLMTKHHVPETTVKNWIAKCRQLGLIPKEPSAAVRVIEDNTGPIGNPSPFSAYLVADTYRTAILNNQRPVTAVAERFNLDRVTAIAYIDRARAAGELPPACDPQLTEEQRRALLPNAKTVPAA
jgi:hypothetical protein